MEEGGGSLREKGSGGWSDVLRRRGKGPQAKEAGEGVHSPRGLHKEPVLRAPELLACETLSDL